MRVQIRLLQQLCAPRVENTNMPRVGGGQESGVCFAGFALRYANSLTAFQLEPSKGV